MNVFIIFEFPAMELGETKQRPPQLTYGFYSTYKMAEQEVLRRSKKSFARIFTDKYVIREIELDTGKLINSYEYNFNGNLKAERSDA